MQDQKEDLIAAVDNLAASYAKVNRDLADELQVKKSALSANDKTILKLRHQIAALESREGEREFRQILAGFIGFLAGAVVVSLVFVVPF